MLLDDLELIELICQSILVDLISPETFSYSYTEFNYEKEKKIAVESPLLSLPSSQHCYPIDNPFNRF